MNDYIRVEMLQWISLKSQNSGDKKLANLIAGQLVTSWDYEKTLRKIKKEDGASRAALQDQITDQKHEIRRLERELATCRERGRKEACRRATKAAVRAGKLTKPHRCEDCDKDLPAPKIHCHHLDYDDPLKVAWVCGPCHNRRHSRKPRMHWSKAQKDSLAPRQTDALAHIDRTVNVENVYLKEEFG